MSEHAELIKAIIKLITDRGGVAVHVFSGLIKTGRAAIHGAEPGTFDVLACYNGHFIAFDAKVGDDTYSPEQLDFSIRVHRNKGIAMPVYHIETVEKELDTLDREGSY